MALGLSRTVIDHRVLTLASSVTSSSITALNQKYALIGVCKRSGTLDAISFFPSTVTAGTTVEARVESVLTTSTGNPSGSLIAANANGSVVLEDTDDNTWKTITMTTPPSLVAGQFYALVLQFSGTVPNFTMLDTNDQVSSPGTTAMGRTTVPFYKYDGASWSTTTNQRGTIFPKWSWGYEKPPGCCLISSVSSGSWASTDSPDEKGIRWTVPYEIGLYSVILQQTLSNSNRSCTLYVYEDSTVIYSVNLDVDQWQPGNANFIIPIFDLTSPFVCQPGKVYRSTLAAPISTSTPNVRIASLSPLTNPPAGFIDDIFCGFSYMGTSRTDLGAWTDSQVSGIASIGTAFTQLARTELTSGHFG